MTKHSFAFLFTIVGVSTGCYGNPCDVGALYQNMTAEQQQSCDQCGNAYGCEGETGEGGEGHLPDVELDLTCEQLYTNNTDWPRWNGPQWCHIGYDVSKAIYQYTYKTVADCAIRHTPVPCDGNWSGLFTAECMLCEPKSWALNPFGPMLATDISEWHYGQLGSDYPAIHPADLLDTEMIDVGGWVDDIKVEWTDYPLGTCSKGFAAINEAYNTIGEATLGHEIRESTWTCRCDGSEDLADSACQSGAVCQAGWIDNGNGWFVASLCTWDDGGGTSNGVAPEGPTVYGLTRWEDGVTIVRNDVTVTPEFLTAAVMGGLWNDDQRFTEDGIITHCGQDALCWLFNLEVNDVVSVDPNDLSDFMEDSIPLTIYVHKPTGAPIIWTVSIAD